MPASIRSRAMSPSCSRSAKCSSVSSGTPDSHRPSCPAAGRPQHGGDRASPSSSFGSARSRSVSFHARRSFALTLCGSPLGEMQNFEHRNTDGQDNPYGKVSSLAGIRRDFPSFRVVRAHKEFIHAPPPPGGAAGAGERRRMASVGSHSAGVDAGDACLADTVDSSPASPAARRSHRLRVLRCLHVQRDGCASCYG